MDHKQAVSVVGHDGGPVSGTLRAVLEGGMIGDRLLLRCDRVRRRGHDRCGAEVASVGVAVGGSEVMFVRRRQPDRLLEGEVHVEMPDGSTVVRRGRLRPGAAKSPRDLISFDKPRPELWDYAWLMDAAPPTVETRCPGCGGPLVLSPKDWPSDGPVLKDRRRVRVLTVGVK